MFGMFSQYCIVLFYSVVETSYVGVKLENGKTEK